MVGAFDGANVGGVVGSIDGANVGTGVKEFGTLVGMFVGEGDGIGDGT